MHKLSIIVPAYNEEVLINKNIKEIFDTLKSRNLNFEIIVVNDGSKDKTLDELKKLKLKNLKIVSYKKNKGKGNAIKEGFNYVKGDIVTFIDSDLDLHPKQIFKFFDYLENADIVVGSKNHPKSKLDFPFHRKILSKLFQTYVRLLFMMNVTDTQVGLKFIKTSCLKRILPKVTIKGFAFDLELLVAANVLKYKIAEAPVVITYKRGGGNITVFTIPKMFIDALKIFYRKNILHYYNK